MSDIKAFPSNYTKTEVTQTGMDLRDYFAGKAIHSICIEVLSRGEKVTTEHCKQAYQLADGMMKAREK